MSEVRVSSAEFIKGYGRFSETALREPVTITSHGRERLVLVSVEEYRRLKRNDREALYPWEMPEQELASLEAAEPPAAAFTHDDEVK